MSFDLSSSAALTKSSNVPSLGFEPHPDILINVLGSGPGMVFDLSGEVIMVNPSE